MPPGRTMRKRRGRGGGTVFRARGVSVSERVHCTQVALSVADRSEERRHVRRDPLVERRRAIVGLEPGRVVSLDGVVRLEGPVRTMLNPAYTLKSEPVPR